jgi:hypothetical protein
MRSKKRSAASSRSRPPERPTLFVDRSLGRHVVADALRQASATVEIHDDHFAPDERDETWLAAVGARGWVVLSKDTRIRYRPNELKGLKEAGAIAVVLTAGNLSGSEMAELFVRTLNSIVRKVRSAKGPALFTFGRDGRLRQVRLSDWI